MSLSLGPGEIRELQRAQRLLLSPLAHDAPGDWCLAVNRSLRPLLGADMVSFLLPGTEEGFFSDEYGPEVFEGYAPYDRRYQREDNRWRRQVEEGVWTRPALWPDLDELYRSDYWDFVRSARAFDALGMSTDRERTARPATLFFHHERPDGPKFGERGEAILRLLYPAFRAGVDQLDRLERRKDDLLGMLDMLPEGAMLVDADGRVLHENPALGALMDADPEGRRLREALDCFVPTLALVAGDGVPPPAEEVLTTASASYSVVPSLLGESLVDPPAVLVSVRRREPRWPKRDRLVEKFGLTDREAEVALLLARRKTNREIAKLLIISPHTARHHTERVLRKLAVRSRAEVGAVLREAAADG